VAVRQQQWLSVLELGFQLPITLTSNSHVESKGNISIHQKLSKLEV
jgi:hypothetical protein